MENQMWVMPYFVSSSYVLPINIEQTLVKIFWISIHNKFHENTGEQFETELNTDSNWKLYSILLHNKTFTLFSRYCF